MKRRLSCRALALLSVFWLGACRAAGDEPGPEGSVEEGASRTGAPTLEELEGATYHGLGDAASVTLVDGAWSGEPYDEGGSERPRVRLVRGFRLAGDLDADGEEEAVTLLNLAPGGTGQFRYVAVVDRSDGQAVNIATELVGDRVQVRGGRIEAGRLYLDVVRPGPGDAACCPGEVATIGWELSGEGLRAVDRPEEPARLSLDAIGDAEWVLREWSPGEAAPELPEVTLRYEGGRLSGSSGCNRYFAEATPGEMPGDLAIGPIGSTRMACPERETAVESRFLAQLEALNRYGFIAGALMLSYETEQGVAVMLFERRGA